MGGTASPLLWCMGYDPLIQAAADITGSAAPTYVDDLAALLASAEQALRVAIALPWLAKVAGLLVETHSCRGVQMPYDPRVADLLADVPVTLTRQGEQLRITGFSADFITALIRHSLGPGPAMTCAPWHSACACKFKTALVPASNHEW